MLIIIVSVKNCKQKTSKAHHNNPPIVDNC